MSNEIDIDRLSEPFDPSDVEWRVSRAGVSNDKPWCWVLAYITARAIQKRLDDVCGPENWRVERPEILVVGNAFAVGISIRINGEWVTKWDVAEPTNIEPAKGGFSGAMKRAGAQWGIGRYLYRLEEEYAKTSKTQMREKGWNYARLPRDKGGDPYYWLTPRLPAWALPKEPENGVSESDLDVLKQEWRKKLAPDAKSPDDLLDGFARFVAATCKIDFPVSDHTCWTRDAYDKCEISIAESTGAAGVSGDVPFDGAE